MRGPLDTRSSAMSPTCAGKTRLRSSTGWQTAVLISACLGSTLAGCGGDARVELAAADALDVAAAQLRLAFDEYHAEIDQADRGRQHAAVGAFVARLRADIEDENAIRAHTADFTEALDALWADQQAEHQRCHNALDNLDAVGEIATGLRRVGIATLTVSDEVRGYFDSLVAARQQAAAQPETNHE
ncbi:MAG: hypothetical protein JSU68_04370 [Phycisphaerales bacterium]|nr:MAG: hypothetical protein JSU68_04370 [Phycisphaerales bacterium]